MEEKGIRVIWRLSGLFVLFLFVAAYCLSIALKPEAAVAEDTSATSPKETLVQ